MRLGTASRLRWRSIQVRHPGPAGYGESSVPEPAANHETYSKRAMARDIVAVMAGLGHRSFSVLGHDRGARVAYRMALDTPEHVERVGMLEVVRTAEMWNRFDAEWRSRPIIGPFWRSPTRCRSA
jgi:haloacetate dehalogenase